MHLTVLLCNFTFITAIVFIQNMVIQTLIQETIKKKKKNREE